jgi:hypothetical protein
MAGGVIGGRSTLALLSGSFLCAQSSATREGDFIERVQKSSTLALKGCKSKACSESAEKALGSAKNWHNLPDFSSNSEKTRVFQEAANALLKMRRVLEQELRGASITSSEANGVGDNSQSCKVGNGGLIQLDIPLTSDACNDCSAEMTAATGLCIVYAFVNPIAGAICEAAAAAGYLDCLCRNRCSQVACGITGGGQ